MTRDLEHDFHAIVRAALDAVEPGRRVRDFLEHRDLAAPRIHVVAFGKAAVPMTVAAMDSLGPQFAGGVVIAPEVWPEATDSPDGLEVFVGGHPIPTDEGVRGAGVLADRASELTAADVLLVLISGGGSALLTLPVAGVSREEIATITERLSRAGADIRELNTVRIALDRLKGGGLARLAAPAPVVALLISDVIGDPPEFIASGPVSPSCSTRSDALAVLAKYDVSVNPGVRAHLEAPETADPPITGVETHVIASNRLAVAAAHAAAIDRGYAATVLTTELAGEARDAGKRLGTLAREIREGPSSTALTPPAGVIAGGETTVTVRGPGRGGRNQELVLAAASEIEGLADVCIGSFGTDGIDGPTDAAGAIATGDTTRRAREMGLDAAKALGANDAYSFFEALGDLIITGPTGTNVGDLQVVLVGSCGRRR